jgi:signal transduction histidine kinase
MVTPQATAKQIVIHRAAGVDAVAYADRMKVEQILLNLLSNAVKFTPPGGRIELRCDQADDRVALRVQDNGVGISAADQVSIFEPFVQVSRTLTSPHEGTGLGLAISRDLAHAMNGELTVESTPGEGSRFTLWLPTRPAAATNA